MADHEALHAMDEKSYSQLDEARKTFSKALDRRRRTWAYDWMIPLIDRELGDQENAKKSCRFSITHVS